MSNLSNLDLVTAVDLNHTEIETVTDAGIKIIRPVYHFIYASELYGTMFAVYAQFEGTETDVAFEINKIKLRLFNYKGIINIGFTDRTFECDVDQEDKKCFCAVEFPVKGASATTDAEIDLSKKKIKSIPVLKGQRRRIKFIRTLYPLADYEHYLIERNGSEVEHQLKDFEPPLVPLFDTEFNYRDGIDLYNSSLKPGMYKPGHHAAGHRCNTSNVNLYFS